MFHMEISDTQMCVQNEMLSRNVVRSWMEKAQNRNSSGV